MKIVKIIAGVLILFGLANPVFWAMLSPLFTIALGLGCWYLIWRGVKALAADKKQS